MMIMGPVGSGPGPERDKAGSGMRYPSEAVIPSFFSVCFLRRLRLCRLRERGSSPSAYSAGERVEPQVEIRG
jgi:hypothetical protein